jgi:hypothetical protein
MLATEFFGSRILSYILYSIEKTSCILALQTDDRVPSTTRVEDAGEVHANLCLNIFESFSKLHRMGLEIYMRIVATIASGTNTYI